MDVRGNTRGTANGQLQQSIVDLRAVSNLVEVRMSLLPLHTQVSLIGEAARRLVRAKLIPSSAVPPEWSLLEALQLLRSDRFRAEKSNQALLKSLWREARNNPALKPFINLVIRTWLLCPAESVVESMGSVLKEVFSYKRQLKHENAAKELIIRWNGPAIGAADRLIHDVQRSHKFDFVRRDARVNTMVGAVIQKHLGKGATSSIFI